MVPLYASWRTLRHGAERGSDRRTRGIGSGFRSEESAAFGPDRPSGLGCRRGRGSGGRSGGRRCGRRRRTGVGFFGEKIFGTAFQVIQDDQDVTAEYPQVDQDETAQEQGGGYQIRVTRHVAIRDELGGHIVDSV